MQQLKDIMKSYLKVVFITAAILFGCNSSKNKKKEQVKQRIIEWIKLNADYPKTYLPVSFTDYEEVDFSNSDNATEKYYRMAHTYKLNSKENQTIETKSYFVLNGDLNINIISNNATSTLQGVPPSVFEWAVTFGENFRNVYYSGYDTLDYFIKFKDYKHIGGNVWKEFDYLDNDCILLLTKSIKNYPGNGARIKRIIKAIPEFETDYDKLGKFPHELGMDIYKLYGKNHALLIQN